MEHDSTEAGGSALNVGNRLPDCMELLLRHLTGNLTAQHVGSVYFFNEH
jgi:hypothetical protein